ncbi:hypothetical protein [Chitinophaga polysaccharea]|nr:hypothetical protein [Chitinophaga polysaccharea]
MQQNKKLSLEELKAKAATTNILQNVEAIKGGVAADCHVGNNG